MFVLGQYFFKVLPDPCWAIRCLRNKWRNTDRKSKAVTGIFLIIQDLVRLIIQYFLKFYSRLVLRDFANLDSCPKRHLKVLLY